jgi:transcriptional regulator with XRE-family HTH domain
MTQEQVIEYLEIRYALVMSQQTLSHIENGKRKVDAERELPAFSGIYGKPIDEFYETLNLSFKTGTRLQGKQDKTVKVDLDGLTQQEKLELAIELIQDVLRPS